MTATLSNAPPPAAVQQADQRLQAEGGAVLRADWRDAAFLHFRVDPAALQPLVPFALDLRDGLAYVSLVAFTQRRLRPKVAGRLAALLCRPLADHAFLNLRTYVRVHDEPGIYFLAEWIPNALAAYLGPRLYGLPYRLAQVRYDIDAAAYRGDIREGADGLSFSADISAAPAAPSDKAPAADDPETEFLLERYSAFTLCRGITRRFRILHTPWPRVPITATFDDLSLLRRQGDWTHALEFCCAHYSPGVSDVEIGRPVKLCIPTASCSAEIPEALPLFPPLPVLRERVGVRAPRAAAEDFSRATASDDFMNTTLPAPTLSARTRLLLGTISFAGSAAYAASFLISSSNHLRLATTIAIAAGISWLIFGLLLRRIARAPLGRLIDACLITQALGIGILMLSVAANLLHIRHAMPFHLLVLAAGDGAMAAAFIALMGRLNMSRPAAAALWIIGLNGPFAAILLLTHFLLGGLS